FAPPSQVPVAPKVGAPLPLQRGQTWSGRVRCTLEVRFTASGLSGRISPVSILILAVGSSLKRLMTQTGTPCAMGGSGGPSLPLPVALTMMTALPGIFTFVPSLFGGTMMSTAVPQVVPERSAGGGGAGKLFGITLTFKLVSGGCGVQLGRLGSVWFGQRATLKSQMSLGSPSVSQASVPSAHVTTFEVLSQPATSNSM